MRQIWFQQTGRESGLRRPDRAVNGYSSRPGTKPIHPQRHLEKGERGKRWRRKNMRCCLFLAAGINYSAKGRDRLTLAILFLVPLMTVVVNIHRQTSWVCATPLPLLGDRNILIPSTERFASALEGLLIRFSNMTVTARTPLRSWPVLFPHPHLESPLFSLSVCLKLLYLFVEVSSDGKFFC